MARSDVKLRRPGSYGLYYSQSPDRSNPQLLDGATVSGLIYVFVTPTDGAASVKFYKVRGETVHRVDSQAPFDLEGSIDGGNAVALDLTGSNDVLRYEAVVQTTRSSTTVLTATFQAQTLVDLDAQVRGEAAISTAVTIPAVTIVSHAPAVAAAVSTRAAVHTPTIIATSGGGGGASAKSLMGVFRNAQVEADVQRFESSQGVNRTVQGDIVVFAGNVTSWGGLLSRCQFLANEFRPRVVVDGNSRLHISLVPYPDKATTLLTMADIASGQHNANFRNQAQTFLDAGYDTSNLSIRPMWEPNGGWYRWSIAAIKDPTCTPANFILAFRQIVNSYRAVIPGLKFHWGLVNGGDVAQSVIDASYPGDDYVDIVSQDLYDYSVLYPNSRTTATQLQAWNNFVNNPRAGLQWMRDFADDHGKLVGYPEWGLNVRTDNHGGNDNPVFIDEMHEWQQQDAAAGRLWGGSYYEHDATDGWHQIHSYTAVGSLAPDPVKLDMPMARARFDALFK